MNAPLHLEWGFDEGDRLRVIVGGLVRTAAAGAVVVKAHGGDGNEVGNSADVDDVDDDCDDCDGVGEVSHDDDVVGVVGFVGFVGVVGVVGAVVAVAAAASGIGPIVEKEK